jgi:hypothetical protein
VFWSKVLGLLGYGLSAYCGLDHVFATLCVLSDILI